MSDKVSSEFPNDLTLAILSILPLKSLIRFRCIQKSWSNLLENLYFKSIYCKNLASKYKYDDSSLLLRHMIPDAYCKNIGHSKLSLLSVERHEKMIELDWPPPLITRGTVLIIGHCINGIICLFQGETIVLWNPAVEESKVVPSDIIDTPGIDHLTRVCGFGYDHVKEDYKVIRAVYFLLGDDNYYRCGLNIPKHIWQIYSFKSDCWRKLDFNIDLNKFFPYDDSLYLNGVSHWKGRSDEKGWILMSFNMSTEVLITTTIPIYLGGIEKRLIVLNESIAMISTTGNNFLEISILGEVGVEESWIKLFTIGPLPCIVHPIGTGNKGEILFKKNDDELACFDLNTQMIVEIDIERKLRVCQAIIYKENWRNLSTMSTTKS